MSDPLNCIVLKNICHSFGDKQILNNLDIIIPHGIVYGLLGPSGCGKTTTVKIMAGILEATKGSVHVLEKKMPNLDIMNKIGYMAQSDALYQTLTGEENLSFFSSLYGMKKNILKQRITEVLDFMNLTEHQHKQVSSYSGGMKRRLSLAMSLIHEPEVLILDEPTVGIDPVLRKIIWEQLYLLAKNGITIVVTTHVMDEADKCHQLAMIREGSLIAQGSPQFLQQNINANSIEEAFIYYDTQYSH